MGIYDRATREKVVLASGNIFLNVMGEYRGPGPRVTVRSVGMGVRVGAQRDCPGNHLPKHPLGSNEPSSFPLLPGRMRR